MFNILKIASAKSSSNCVRFSSSGSSLRINPISNLKRFNYSTSVNTDPFSLAKQLSGKHFINGEFKNAKSTFSVVNPATGEEVGKAAKGDSEDVNAAVSAAVTAQKTWANMHVKQRAELVSKCAQVLKEHSEELARLTSLETGKALRTESRVEAGVCSDSFTFFAGLGAEIKGETVPFNPSTLTYSHRYPVGVVGAIVPWNAPLMLFSLKCAPALICGNAVVLKSAEEAPFGVLRVVELLNTVLPKGLVNCVSGFGPECGAPLVSHPQVDKITFTGSVETGKIVYKTAADKLIPVTLELGGKSPMIVMSDANVDKAVDGAIVGMRFTRQGQSCSASSRIFVHEKVHDDFVQKLKAKVDAMKMGDPLDDKTDIGTIISQAQFDKVNNYISLGRKLKGANALECSQMPTDPKFKKGLFAKPVIFTGIDNSSVVAREEIFGPVCCIIKWNDWEKVLKDANDTEYGLAATIWTNDLKAAMTAANQLEAGIVQVNQNFVLQPNLQIGGWKNSGLGTEGSLGSMLEGFTKLKTVSINLN
eukprot:TRINITY_DN895_c0_g1_i1.p1 TRINITY_DN895_c0_g1~~TRINITY_DN895_c0_g1_i1.p1  ORF type:complete len:533 (-),score=193.28 TRINITY_DN895_c0_g1_i1:59-1657(-)